MRRRSLFRPVTSVALSRPLLDDAFKDRSAVWSPDGTRLAFFSDRSGSYEIWTIRRDGSDLQQITRGAGAIEPHWSPDGTKIVASYAQAHRYGTLFDAKPGSAVRDLPAVAGFSGFGPTAWSRDGRYICGELLRQDGHADGIALYSLANQQYEVISDTGTRGLWINDHMLVCFDHGQLFSIDPHTRQKRLIGAVPFASPSFRCAIAPDGSRIYYSTLQSDVAVWMLQFEGAS
jgi:hypothetical protein